MRGARERIPQRSAQPDKVAEEPERPDERLARHRQSEGFVPPLRGDRVERAVNLHRGHVRFRGGIGAYPDVGKEPIAIHPQPPQHHRERAQEQDRVPERRRIRSQGTFGSTAEDRRGQPLPFLGKVRLSTEGRARRSSD